MEDDKVEPLQRLRKEKIAKLERDLKLMEAQRQEDVSKAKAEVLRIGIDEARNTLLPTEEKCLRSPGSNRR